MKIYNNTKDKYGRGSAALNGLGFVDLEPGDTFNGLETKLRAIQTLVYENTALGIMASIVSRRNANELTKHMAPGESEEAHKFAAKNVGLLFSLGTLGVRHFDKKAIRDDVPKPVMLRVFTSFIFADESMLATITLRAERDGNKLYAIEALEIKKDTDSERTPRGETAPLQNLMSLLTDKISYYVGDVKRTKPTFVGVQDPFTIRSAAEKLSLLIGCRRSHQMDIAVIILVGREELHIGRCLDRLRDLNPRQIFVVESQTGDRTHEIAVEKGAATVFNAWPGTQALQFNWALDHLPIEVEWILRLDADEYLTTETIESLRSPQRLQELPENVAGVTLELKRWFCGGEICHATNGIRQVRLFRRGCARYAETLMDERLIVGEWQNVEGVWKCAKPGTVVDFDGAFYDDNLNDMDWWRAKHRDYAKREAEQALAGTFRDSRKAKYYELPPYLRAVTYFCIRYFLKGGILDGYAGWMWNFWQGLWYRWIVDCEIARLKRLGK